MTLAGPFWKTFGTNNDRKYIMDTYQYDIGFYKATPLGSVQYFDRN